MRTENFEVGSRPATSSVVSNVECGSGNSSFHLPYVCGAISPQFRYDVGSYYLLTTSITLLLYQFPHSELAYSLENAVTQERNY
jgi:hypothetical protein